ncbi:MAG: ABC transporter ATP-binding protein [Pirellulaceae bacterium]|nr:ABC transporter ATP-binding protein [Pirellulaceae bacterium]
MKKFGLAIRDSFHHWPLLVLATICSMGVATLWSVNIGAMLPVIDMTLQGNSMQKQLGKTADEIEAKLMVVQQNLDAAKERSEKTDADQFAIADEIKHLGAEAKDLSSTLAWQRWQLGLAERYLPADPFQTICWIMGIMLASTVVRHLLLLANDLLVGRVSTTIARSIRLRVFDKALAYDRNTYQGYGTSGLLAGIANTTDTLTNGLIAFFGLAIREPLRIIACLIGAALIYWRLLLLSALLAPLLVLVVYWFNGRVRSIARSMLNQNAGFHEVILEALSNVFTVQAYTMEAEERKRFAGCTQGMQRNSMRMILYTGLSKPLTELIGVGMIAVTVCAGAYLIVNKETHLGFIPICDEPMTPSRLMIFFAMLIGASDPLRRMSGVMTAIYSGSIAADSLYNMLEKPAVLVDPVAPVVVPAPHKSIAIENLSFAYTEGNPILKGVNLEIPFGQTVAIIGANGSGKSTLIQLLCRFYDPVEGTIKMDGVDFHKMSIASLRKRIALVSQQTELFNRSVLENIQYGSPDSTREEAIEAAKLAFAHDFITNSLENGYETIVGQSGQRLSGGQRQRIAMARAILRKPEILILDESTSQIDMVSELQIRQSLSDLKRKSTIIIIAHREALMALADETYEVVDGRLIPVTNRLKASA